MGPAVGQQQANRKTPVMDGSEIAIGASDWINGYLCRSKHELAGSSQRCWRSRLPEAFIFSPASRALCCFFKKKNTTIFKCRGWESRPACLAQGRVISEPQKGPFSSSGEHQLGCSRDFRVGKNRVLILAPLRFFGVSSVAFLSFWRHICTWDFRGRVWREWHVMTAG